MTAGVFTDPPMRTIAQPVSPASAIARLRQRAALLLLVAVSFGFPITALIVTFLSLDSQSLTVPYRIAIAALSVVIILLGLFTRTRGRLDPWLTLFLVMYLARLIYDYSTNSIIGNLEAIQFYVAVVLLPLLAINLGGGADHDDAVFAKLMVVVGLAAASMALIAQSLGLGYNPWEIYGTTDVRLGFQALNSISLGHASTTTALTSLFILLGTNLHARWKLIALAALAISGTLLITAGSRGALIAFVVSICWFGLTKFKRLVVLGPFLTLALIFGVSQSKVFQSTVASATGGLASDASGLVRLTAQQIAIEDFIDSPVLGKHYFNPSLDAGEYPHNLFIESAMALGIFGLVLFLIANLRALRAIFGRFGYERPLLSLIFVQYLVGSFISGSLWAADLLSIYLMIILTSGKSADARFINTAHAGR